MNLDRFFDRVYNDAKYNCAHFVCEVWKELNNQDISEALTWAKTGRSLRVMDAHRLGQFERILAPVSPCLALFQANQGASHVGIWLDGKILHLAQNGVEWTYLETVMIGFRNVRFYNVKKNYNC